MSKVTSAISIYHSPHNEKFPEIKTKILMKNARHLCTHHIDTSKRIVQFKIRFVSARMARSSSL